MKIELLFLGKTKEKYLAAGIDDFVKRIQRYAQIEIHTIREKRFGESAPDSLIRDEEAKVLLERVNQPTMLIAMDSTGKQVSSDKFAELIQQWQEQGRRSITFLIGGPTGLAPAVTKKADFILSLSKMTFTHEMARLILLEQVYRAFSILAGTKYHK